MEESRIITIRKESIDAANEAFAYLMKKTENQLNDDARCNTNKYKGLKSDAFESICCNVIKSACKETPFDEKNVVLVSGQKFPDIVTEKYFGVEVKSTKQNHWTSTGSSIVESTRVENVDNIYMLFGKLGGNPAEFKCRPYQDVLSEITVTHSPRYLINMDLKSGETIFDKMNVSYDELRTSDDSISRIRQYYRDKAKGKNGQMPWWISGEDDDSEPLNMNLRLWATLTTEETTNLTAQMSVLFPELLHPNGYKEKYYRSALWLAGSKGIVFHNFRDSFSAGGQVKQRNGISLKTPLPHVFYTLYSTYPYIKPLLSRHSEILEYILEYNPELLSNGNMNETWIEQIKNVMKPQDYGIDIKDFLTKTVSLDVQE